MGRSDLGLLGLGPFLAILDRVGAALAGRLARRSRGILAVVFAVLFVIVVVVVIVALQGQ